MSLGSNIRKRRFELNMTQQELARRMGYKSRATIAKIESGENDVSHAKLIRLAQVLDTSFELLTTGVDSVNYESSYEQTGTGKKRELSDSETARKNAVVLLAGGKSVRNHQNIPNQFVEILGKPVIMYCMEPYQHHPLIDDIYVVCLKGWEEIIWAYAKQYGITKLRDVITGGNTGIESIKIAVDAISKQYGNGDILVFQEATRPLITGNMISKLLQACVINNSATVCQSMRDHVQFLVGDYKAEYIKRDAVVDLQSPEAHKFFRVREVFERAKQQSHPLVESCCTLLMHNLGFKINFIEGSLNNIKIIRQEDIALATALLKISDY